MIKNNYNLTYPAIHYGPWSQRTTKFTTIMVKGEEKILEKNTCTRIMNDNTNIHFDPYWKAVRAFSIITLIIGIFQTLSLWFIPCYTNSRLSGEKKWKFIAFVYLILLTFFQSLSFLWYLSGSACDEYSPIYPMEDDYYNEILEKVYSNKCEWGSGSTSALVSTILFFSTGFVMLIIGAPKYDPIPPPEVQQVSYQKTENVDGTKTIQEVNVVKEIVQETAIPHGVGTEA